MILAVDSSLPLFSVALVENGMAVAALLLEGRESRNEKLLPSIDWLFAESGSSRERLTLLVTTRGPGSFTGVRVGMATVSGLAMALAIPVCALSTHEAMLAGASRDALVYNDAGRGEFYVSGFREGREVLAPALMGKDRLDELRGEWDESIDIAVALKTQNPALNAALAAEKISARRDLDRYSDTSPIYVRLAEAEIRLRQRDAAR
ncbi:MAG: tRNA (adenosine(37)-N6)-threonylcarbamoyltransferase complex dimerization subunit type 1 TsaB [Thermoanaerobaculia bacterium]